MKIAELINQKDNSVKFMELINDLQNRNDALINHSNELIELIKELQEKNNILQKNFDLYKEIFPFVQCKFPPFVLADILKISSNTIVKIAKELKLFEDELCAIRIKRVKKSNPQNHETTILFSFYGFCLLYENISNAISDTITNRNTMNNEKMKQIIDKNFDKLIHLFLDYSLPVDEELRISNERQLAKIWDNKEEDEAWAFLSEAK